MMCDFRWIVSPRDWIREDMRPIRMPIPIEIWSGETKEVRGAELNPGEL